MVVDPALEAMVERAYQAIPQTMDDREDVRGLFDEAGVPALLTALRGPCAEIADGLEDVLNGKAWSAAMEDCFRDNIAAFREVLGSLLSRGAERI